MFKPVRVIVDTDIGPDCDDAAALAVLHALADRGEAEIVGVTHCTSSPWGVGCIDAINNYYGRPDIPIGTLKEPGFLDQEGYRKFNRYITQNYPNRFAGGEEAPGAVAALREWLAKELEQGVVLIAIGPLPNLRNLLQSEADEHSTLSGVELVKQKVSQLVVMGGAFPEGKEWNFEMCPQSAQYVVAHWPTPIMFTGFEIGYDIMTGARLCKEAPEDHPVREAYERFLGQAGDRHSWDLTAILYGVRGLADYWEAAAAGGCMEVDSDGTNRWLSTPNKGHRYLQRKMAPQAIGAVLDELLAGRLHT